MKNPEDFRMDDFELVGNINHKEESKLKWLFDLI